MTTDWLDEIEARADEQHEATARYVAPHVVGVPPHTDQQWVLDQRRLIAEMRRLRKIEAAAGAVIDADNESRRVANDYGIDSARARLAKEGALERLEILLEVADNCAVDAANALRAAVTP